jgi:hypothetical protein
MGFKVTIRKNGAKHGEVHYSSEAVAVGMAQKMTGGGVKATVEKTGTKSNPRRRRNPGWTEAELVAFLKDRPDGVTVKELVYGFGGTAQAHTKRLAALVTKGVLTHEPWATGGGHYLLALRANRRRNGTTSANAAASRSMTRQFRR